MSEINSEIQKKPMAVHAEIDFSSGKETEIEMLRHFVNHGIEMMKRGEFEPAMKYFQQKTVAEQFGIHWGHAKSVFIEDDIKTREEAEEGLHVLIWTLGGGYQDTWGEKGQLKIPYCRLREKPKGLLGVFSRNIYVHPRFYQEFALVGAEEWLHALQYLGGELLTDYRNAAYDEKTIKEIDVMLYLLRKGVELTDSWISNYPQRKEILQKEHFSSMRDA